MPENSIPYFGEKEEQAVINFINSDSLEERNTIYNNILKDPFKKMIQSILRKYPIHIGNYSMYEVESDALVHLIDKMNKFNPDTITKKGNKTKAYSYCQTIVRNYFRDHGRKTYNEKKTNLNYDDYVDVFDNDDQFSYELNDSESFDKLELLINGTIIKIEEEMSNKKITLKKNDIIVGNAIINILKNWKMLFLDDSSFQKNNILFFIREQTGLTTKDIRSSIKSFKKLYLYEKDIHINL